MPAKKNAKDSFSAFSQQSTAILRTYTQKLQPDRRLFPSQKALFPLLDVFEMDINWKLTILGIVFETLQLMGFLVNSHIAWGTGIKGIIDKVFYFFVLPFFDENWIKGLVILWYVLICFLLVLAVAVLVVIVFFTRNNVHSMPSLLSWFLKYFMHLLPSVLLIPFFSILGATGSCDRPYEKNYWDSQQCFTGVGGLFHFLSYVTMILYGAITYISVAFCFDDMPDNTNLAARPRCSFHAIGIIAKVVVTLLYHILIPVEEPLAFSIVCLVIAVAMLFLHVFILPYYDMLMNKLRGAQWGVFAGVSVAAVVCECMDASFTTKIYSLIFLAVGIVVGGLVGFFLPLFRRSRRLAHRMSVLNESGRTEERPPEFPSRLPTHDLVLSKYPRIEKLIMGDKQSSKSPKGGGNSSPRQTHWTNWMRT